MLALTHAEATRRQYRYLVLKTFAALMVGPGDLTEEALIEHLNAIPAKGSMRAETAKALKSFYAHTSTRFGFANPCDAVAVRQPRQGPAPRLTDPELRAILRAAFRKDRRRGWALMFLYTTGARRESAAAVRPEDVTGGEVHFKRAKGDKPYAVPLGRAGRIAVAHLIDLGGETLLGVAAPTLWDWAHQAGEAAGVHAYPHLLRHVYGHKVSQKADPRTWMDLMNHADLSQYRRYTWASDDRKRDAVEDL